MSKAGSKIIKGLKSNSLTYLDARDAVRKGNTLFNAEATFVGHEGVLPWFFDVLLLAARKREQPTIHINIEWPKTAKRKPRRSA